MAARPDDIQVHCQGWAGTQNAGAPALRPGILGRGLSSSRSAVAILRNVGRTVFSRKCCSSPICRPPRSDGGLLASSWEHSRQDDGPSQSLQESSDNIYAVSLLKVVEMRTYYLCGGQTAWQQRCPVAWEVSCQLSFQIAILIYTVCVR